MRYQLTRTVTLFEPRPHYRISSTPLRSAALRRGPLSSDEGLLAVTLSAMCVGLATIFVIAMVAS
ncbi:hypothetical protein APT59_10065 [Pseudomonas oryzihabitans]|uniref:Uncharacterized protein n=1 Tax=Pseudomonas oryzihabitans TaxID=47885 RepID=A0A0U4WGY9_9PSED|nr:hypothetical protein APT59_10065 [Pseudomonas oryzihabitans]